ncbi:histidinol dehydrogenase [Dichotomicrobium thermohalophilum]|uniref:Histidinol dehydrogenase n=1 Tax=Dichotomicrobium thermohalophilum TaxID=933063 RepID=A0A397PN97_9HYPH|nr:histidinol dehydrogenase [Dichotomicrobium thermohalophilum]RIA47221.1 histidinol dehydrogenase [Dichotomicrobium thermohalophilum]
MPVSLNTADADFARQFDAFLAARREEEADVSQTVARIIADVRERGDGALAELTKRFDEIDLAAAGIRVSDAEMATAVAEVAPETMDALKLARDRIEAFHRRQLPSDDRYTDEQGAELGCKWTAVDSAGLYVPGGQASYPSSVLMNAVPAKVAGVPRVAMVVPTPAGVMNPLVFAAAQLAGVDEVYRIGGAQAVAALAFGTETVQPVAKIVGPGNAYVAEAKRQVFGVVGIDSIAGPSEVLIVADKDNRPDWIAADLLAQAEHDAAAQSILITDDGELAEAVSREVEKQLATLPRGNIAGASWERFGALITVAGLDEAPDLVNRLAPEHLELATADPEALMKDIRNAGAIFLGHYTPEAVGDYVAGPNHVLPTSRTARFSSGLSVLDFMKRSSILRLSADALRALGPAAMTLADAEGLDAHARSIEMRLNR